MEHGLFILIYIYIYIVLIHIVIFAASDFRKSDLEGHCGKAHSKDSVSMYIYV